MTELTNNGGWALAVPTEDDIVITLFTEEWEHNSAVKEVKIGDKLKCKNRVIIRFVSKQNPAFVVSEQEYAHATLKQIKNQLRGDGFRNVR